MEEEKVQEETVEKEDEPPSEQDFADDVKNLKSSLGELKDKNKFLSAELTRNQQENAEFVRLFKSRMDMFQDNGNDKKSFNESWEESPEKAVERVSETKVRPVEQKLKELTDEQKKMQANLWVSEVVNEDPDFKDLETDVRNKYGWEHTEWTKSKEGIRDLFLLAKAKTPKKEDRVEREKERAYTEGGSPRENKPTVRSLNAYEARVAEKLRVKPEDYNAFKSHGGKSRPKNWKSENQRRRDGR